MGCDAIRFSTLLLLFFLLVSSVFGQISIHGKVLDSEGRSVPFATIQLLAIDSVTLINHDVTNDKGEFIVVSKSVGRHVLKIRHLNYNTKIDILEIDSVGRSESSIYSLEEKTAELESVIVNAPKAAMEQRGDTISYNLDLFLNGKEDKLKDILAKLPGVEITPDGKILANGRMISDLLVDGVTVFGNNHKILLETLNAEIVDGVDLLSNYEKNRILSGLESKDETAINIKVKEEYRGKVTGDIEASLATGKRFGAKANGYRFGLKNSLAIISDANSLNRQILTAREYNDFKNHFTEDVFSSGQDQEGESKEVSSFFNEDQKILKRKVGLIGLSYGQKLGEKFSLNLFSLLSRQNQEKRLFSEREFLNLEEEDLISEQKEELFRNSISQNYLTLDYHTQKIEIKYNILLNIISKSQNDSILSNDNIGNAQILAQRNIAAMSGFHNQLTITKRIKEEGIIHFKGYFNTSPSNQDLIINSDSLLWNSSFKSISQTAKKIDNDLGGQISYKLYKPKYIIGFHSGVNSKQQELSMSNNYGGLYQDILITNFSLGTSLKKKHGRFTFSYDLSLASLKTKNEEQLLSNQVVFLPFAKAEWKFNDLHTISAEFSRFVHYPSIEQLIRKKVFIDYRTLATGSSILVNDLSIVDQVSINHQFIDLYHGITLYNFFRYNNQDVVYTSDSNFENGQNSLAYRIGKVNKTLVAGSMIELRFSDLPLQLKTTNTFAKLVDRSFTNGVQNDLEVFAFDSKTELKPRIPSGLPIPVIGVLYNQTYAEFQVSSNKNNLMRFEPFIAVTYFWKDIETEVSFAQEKYISGDARNNLSKLNFRIGFDGKSNNWVFSLIGRDILNLKTSELLDISNSPSQLIRNRVSRFPGYFSLSVSRIF